MELPKNRAEATNPLLVLKLLRALQRAGIEAHFVIYETHYEVEVEKKDSDKLKAEVRWINEHEYSHAKKDGRRNHAANLGHKEKSGKNH